MDKKIEVKRITINEKDDSDTNDSASENSNISNNGNESNNSNSNNGSGNTKRSVKDKFSKVRKEISMCDNMKFMEDFDPELSNREKRKLSRKFSDGKKVNNLYDENGILSICEKDICDCLTENCPGCHFPCPKCRSYKCGTDCRVNRKWMFEVVEYEGDINHVNSFTIQNGNIIYSTENNNNDNNDNNINVPSSNNTSNNTNISNITNTSNNTNISNSSNTSNNTNISNITNTSNNTNISNSTNTSNNTNISNSSNTIHSSNTSNSSDTCNSNSTSNNSTNSSTNTIIL